MACNIVSERLLAEYLGLGASNVLVSLASVYAERACDQYVGFQLASATKTEFYPAFDHFEADAFVDVRPTITLQRTDLLKLRRRPVKASGLLVYEDSGAYMGQGTDAFPVASLLTLGTDYVLDLDEAGGSLSGNLLRLGGSWSSTVGSIKVTYLAGFTTNELKGDLSAGSPDIYDGSNVQQAVLMAAMKNYNELKRQQPGMLSGVGGPLTYEKIEGYEYAVDKFTSASLYGMSMALPPISKKLLHEFVNYGARLIA